MRDTPKANTGEALLIIKWKALPHMNMDEFHWAIVTDGKWGSESTPVMICNEIPKIFAEHIVALHNRRLTQRRKVQP